MNALCWGRGRGRLVGWPRVIWLALLAGVLITAPASAAPPAPRPAAAPARAAFAPGEVLIGWQPGDGLVPTPPDALRSPAGRPRRSKPLVRSDAAWQAAAAAVNAQTKRQVLEVQPAYGYALLAVPVGQERGEMARLATLPWVRYAEPNYLVYPTALAADPNDPYYWQQWNLAMVSAPRAWNVTTGLSLITVAVLDTGVDFSHTDLAGRLRSDGVNYIKPGTPPQDDDGHGTHVAGIIAADTNNGIGVAGMAGKVMILPYKVLGTGTDGTVSGTVASMTTAIYAAVSSNAQIINVSAGTSTATASDLATLQNAIASARSSGVLVVASAGNDGSAAAGNPVFYPAAFPEALAVAATDHLDSHPDYSGHQPYVALSAPGGTSTNAIVSTYWPNTYANLYGTSMAAPLVSGAAALILSVNPTMKVDDLIYTLEHTADKVGPYAYVNGRNDYYGYGRLNVGRAVTPLRASAQHVSLAADCSMRLADTVTLQNVLNQSVNWVMDPLPGQGWLGILPAGGTLAAGGAATLTVYATTDGLASGSYDGLVRLSLPNTTYPTLEISVHLSYINGVPYCSSLPLVVR